ncbi:MAG: signal peptidase I [Dethiobacter sp.]|nr:signal peptidase I [Dethiobacter sp.]
MENTITKRQLLFVAGRKIAQLAGKLFFAATFILMALLVFFLLQSRLAGGVPTVAGYQLYIVLSGSMSPAFETGSIVLVRQLEPALVQVNDIITYYDPERQDTITTHRVVEILPTQPLMFVTRGDANDANDTVPVFADNLVGRVAFSLPYLGYLFSFVNTGAGILFLIIVPSLLMIASELRKLMSYVAVHESVKKGGGV